MTEVNTITDATLAETLNTSKPVLLLISDGSDLRGDFSTAFKKAASEEQGVVFARINPQDNPETVARFNIGRKSVMIGLFDNEEIVRRSRPWGTDVPLGIERLKQIAADSTPPSENDLIQSETESTDSKENPIVDNKPVNVTDETFQAEVIDYSEQMPVLVDFWAEWCGPCRMVGPILEKLAEEYAGKIRVAKVDVDANQGLAQYFQVMSIPTIMVLKNRTQIFSQPGAFPEAAFRDLIDQAVNLEVPLPEAEAEQEPAAE